MSDGDYNFIVDNIKFSFSSTTTFEHCEYAFKLSYIDIVPKQDNFFGDYGRFIHECYEKFFNRELDYFELSDYYRDNFFNAVKSAPPPYPYGMAYKYRKQGQAYFDNFSFDIEKYNVITVEDTIDFILNDISFTARPDLVLQDKETKIYYLYDYKTSTPIKTNKKTGKETRDKKKIDGYERQLYLYAYALRNERDIPIEKMVLMFPRLGKNLYFDWEKEKETEVIDWIVDLVSQIKKSSTFPYNNKSQYFCQHICSVRDHCKFKDL